MTKRLRLVLIAAALVLMGAMASTSAQASRGISSTLTQIGASGQLVMNNIVTCDVLLALFLNDSVIEKQSSTSQGEARPGWIRNCRGATDGSINNNIPVRFARINGTLPNITGVGVEADAPQFQLNGLLPCTGTPVWGGSGSVLRGVLIQRNTTTGAATSVDFDGSSSLPRISGGGLFCPANATITGQLRSFLRPGDDTGSWTPPTLTLV